MTKKHKRAGGIIIREAELCRVNGSNAHGLFSASLLSRCKLALIFGKLKANQELVGRFLSGRR